MDGYVELAKLIKQEDNDNNIFIGEIITTSPSPLKIRVNGNDLTTNNMLISDTISNFHIGQKVVALKYSTRLYIIIARVVKE